MEIFTQFVTLLARVPAFVPLLILPLLCAALVALLGFLGGRKLYPALCTALVGIGFALVSADGAVNAFVYLGIFTAWGALLGCLLFLPKLKKRVVAQKGKAEKMYEKFREELIVPESNDGRPPKVCCFEDSPAAAQLEAPPQLDHADALLNKLASAKLNPSDRLETDALRRKLDLYRGKALTKQEARSLNDCLSSVLKLTAKYQL